MDATVENQMLENWKHTAPEIGLRTVLKCTNRGSSTCLRVNDRVSESECVYVCVKCRPWTVATAGEKRRGVNESDCRCKLCALRPCD